MKLFALLCLVGFAVASVEVGPLRWTSGKTYRFKYSGRLLTGLPELNAHYSGLGLTCSVDLHVGQGRKFSIQIKDPQFVRINGVLESDAQSQDEQDNWRKLKLPAFSEVPEEFRQSLAQPVVMEYSQNGNFLNAVVNQDEPEWSINFKKALIALFQTKYENDASLAGGLENNMIETLSQEGREFGNDYWRTREESVDGVCDVIYQVNEIPKYMVKENPQMLPKPQLCEGGKTYEVTKTRDVSSCSRRTSFISYKPGFFRCPTGNCEGMWTRSSVTRYVACGSRDNLKLQSIHNEGELIQNLFGFKTEKFLTGTKQTLELVDEAASSSSELPYPQNQVQKDQLFYEYDNSANVNGNNRNNGAESPLVEPESLEQLAYKTLPRNILTGGRISQQQGSNFNPAEIMEQIKKLVQEIVTEDLHKIENLPEKQITMKSLSLARAFSVLSKDQINQVYQELKNSFQGQDRQTFKNVFFDTVVMGGSANDIIFIKEQIQQGELSQVQIISFFTFLPHYVLAPTASVLDHLFELVSSNKIREQGYVYNHAIMSYTTLIQKACLADNRQTSYPTFVLGSFCNPDSDIVLNKWIPYLQRELEQASSAQRRNVLIVTLGLLSHKNVLPILVPYVENRNGETPSSNGANGNGNGNGANGNGNEQSERSRLTRFLAVYSLSQVGRQYPQLVEPLVFAVFNNQAEATEIRIAAFHVLMKTNPSMTVFHRIAASTWQERDQQVLMIINTAIFTLAQQKDAEPINPFNSGMQRKAWLVYPLIKKVPGRFPTSGSLYSAEYLPAIGVGYTGVNSWTANRDSFLPTDVYQRIVYYLDRYQFTPLEVAIRVRGAENMIQQLIELVSSEDEQQQQQNENEDPEDAAFNSIKNQLHQEWRQTLEKLRIKNRGSQDAEGAFFLNLFEDSPMFHSFQTESTRQLREQIKSALRSKTAQELLSGENEVSFQRLLNLSPSEFSIPSDMGFPIVIEVHMPVTFSAKGKFQSEMTSLRQAKVNMDVKVMYATQLAGWVGTICPFTNEFIVTAIDKHSVISIPADFNINIDLEQGLFELTARALNTNSPVDLFHFHVRPFTVYQKLWSLTPLTLSPNVKPIHSRSQAKTVSYSFGEYLGLNLKGVLSTESAFVDFRTVMEKIKMYNYNPLNMLRFSWASGALGEDNELSLRKHEFQIKYDASASSTKELRFKVQFSFGTKVEGESLKVHKLVERNNGLKVEQRNPEGHEQKLEQLMQKTGVQNGQGATVKVSLVLGGRRQRTFSYTLNAITGFQGLNQKWDLSFESESSAENKLCVRGELRWPENMPAWKLNEIMSQDFRFKYENFIGAGRNCEESTMKIEGSTSVSQQQKNIAKESEINEQYQQLKQKGVPMAELSEAAQKLRILASQLDEVDFAVKYNNVPRQYMVVSEYFGQYLKAIWWPYLVQDSENAQSSASSSRNAFGDSGVSQTNVYRFRINSRTQTFNLEITKPHEHIRFQHVRIPFPLSYFVPLPAVREGLVDLPNQVIGKPLYPKCMVEGRYIRTFDNLTIPAKIDDCWHLLAGDCSAQKQWGVLLREKKGSQSQQDPPKELKLFLGQTKIELIPNSRHSRYSSNIELTVNGTEVPVHKDQVHIIRDHQGNYVAQAKRYEDGVLRINARQVNILFDGNKIQIEASYLDKNKVCGLCGDLNGQKQADLRGPQKCVLSQPEVVAAAYRVQDGSCSPLPSHVQQKLQQENQECAKYEALPTKVSKGFKAHAGKCLTHHHEIIEKHSELCFSRKPVTQCGAQCRPESREAEVEKRVSFTCLSKNRTSQRYAEKIREGQILSELAQQPETFSLEVRQVKACVPVNNNL